MSQMAPSHGVLMKFFRFEKRERKKERYHSASRRVEAVFTEGNLTGQTGARFCRNLACVLIEFLSLSASAPVSCQTDNHSLYIQFI
jgi:hypothetical protein